MTLGLELEPYRARFTEPFSNARASWQERAGLVLRLADGSGAVGQGEAAPLPGYSPDTLDDARRALEALDREHVTRLAAVDSLDALRAGVEQLVSERAPSAQCALETALLDLRAQRAEKPLHRLLCGTAPAPRLELAALAPTRAAADRAVDAGFTTLKLKLGSASFASDLELVAALRRELGGRVRLRLDANRSLPPGQGHLEALAAHAPELVEEPFSTATLPRSPPVPLALDESLHTPAAVLGPELARDFGVVAAVLKPSLVGGPLRALALARAAAGVGLAPIVSHAFEGPIGFGLACELALALGVASHAAGLGPHGALAAWGVAVPALAGATLAAHSAPGLGLPVLRPPR